MMASRQRGSGVLTFKPNKTNMTFKKKIAIPYRFENSCKRPKEQKRPKKTKKAKRQSDF